MKEELTQVKVSEDAKANLKYQAQKKSLLVGYLLLLFFGALGIHRFYLSKNKSAFVMLLLTIFGWLTVPFGVVLILMIAVAIWILIDAFLLIGYVNQYNLKLIDNLTH